MPVDNPHDLTSHNRHHDNNHHKTPASRPQRLIALSIAEIRRLFNLATTINHGIDLGIYWSNLRRAHQATARLHHFRRRLRLQMIQI